MRKIFHNTNDLCSPYLPAWLSFLIVSAVTTAVTLCGLYFVRRRYPAELLKENHEVAASIFNAFGLLYGVVVAFVVFVAWSRYDDATKNLQRRLLHRARFGLKSCQ